MYNSAFVPGKNTSGSGDTDTVGTKTLTAGQHVLVTVWNFSTTPVSGSVVYIKDGGAEVSLGTPLQSVDRTGTSDAIASFFLRSAAAGDYVLRAKNLPYVHISGIVIDAQPNCWIRVGTNAEGTGTTFTSSAVVPYWGESIAIGYCTHNADGANPNSLTQGGSWTLVHKQEDYDGDSQPGLLQYLDNISGTSSVTATTTSSESTAWCQLIVVISEPPDVYMIMGGATGLGYFGRESAGGADNDHFTDFLFGGIPADQAIAVGMSLYDYEPSDASLLTLNGSGNSLVKTAGVTDGAGNDGSFTWFHTPTPLASACTRCTFDATALAGGDAGRYGQIGYLIMRYPDTVNGIYTGTAVTNVQTDTTTINPGLLSLATTKGVRAAGGTVRGHADDNAPVTTAPNEFLTYLRHSEWEVAVQAPAGFSCWQNSDIQSGWFGAEEYEDEETWDLEITLSASTGTSRSVAVSYNTMGGSVPGGGGVLLPILQQHHG
jgi:hypothetical protein